ncbi:MAG: DNA mismatch repair protein MutS [Deltaproteobacteria bacterium]|nr:DNA mismatch repair protein MutS [Deltaproteobacteria bacterium]
MSVLARETPMMRQYAALKAQHPGAFLFYRMGDFYELFFDDAVRAAPLLEVTLTSRDKDKPDPIPMCGVPVHAADAYIKRLSEKGHRVAICEQTEDPRSVGGRRLVRREVIEVITPGLVGDPNGLPAAREVALAAVAITASGDAGLAALDASTGHFRATQAPLAHGALPRALLDELERIAPRECVIADDAPESVTTELGARLPQLVLSRAPAASFASVAALLAADTPGADLCAASAVLAYLEAHQPSAAKLAPKLRRYALADTMILDAATRRHLELFESAEDRSRRGTLIERIDETITALGARRLAHWLAYPLLAPDAIRARQAGVAWLAERDRARARLRSALGAVRDLERQLAKCARPGCEPRDLATLRASLAALPEVRRALASDGAALVPEAAPASLALPRELQGLVQLLLDAIVDEPRPLPRGSRGAGETGFIREGFRPELDALREAAHKGREWIAGLEARERERSGIASLKVRYQPVFGYGLEVPKAQLARVPADYERKQTLASAERFTTRELREMESQVLGANDRAAALEREVLENVRQSVLAEAARIRAAADAVAELDALQSLAEVARRDGWTRPELSEGGTLEIRGGRHPVVERVLQGEGAAFVANDTALEPSATRVLLLTGPNMSGKSTYLRQVALIVLLAQIGSFVPAASARVGVVDRIFTRVGASDRLAQGQSTFMVEMRETAEILGQATTRSLVILDEIGRGTSTFDGLSIAWAVAEFIHDAPGLGCRTLFATHYHELADLALAKAAVANAHFEAREVNGEAVFLRRLVDGPASRSYGIEVAKLAGLPASVITRARQLLAQLEAGELDARGRPRLAAPDTAPASPQLSLFAPPSPRDANEDAVLAELRASDANRTTPLAALALLDRWRRRLEGEAK